jgi:hypothetical protein
MPELAVSGLHPPSLVRPAITLVVAAVEAGLIVAPSTPRGVAVMAAVRMEEHLTL